MARTAAGAALTRDHYRAQLQVRARAMRDFTLLWPLWQGDGRSFDRLVAATVPLVRAHHQISSSVATAYYRAFRTAECAGGSPAPQVGELNDDAVTASLYVTGKVMTGKAINAGQSPQAAMQTALTRTAGAVSQHVLNGGRDTIVLSSAGDREAQGWARVTAGNPCAFCVIQASRGPVFSEDTADFQAHDHCACMGEPHYEGADWPGRAREFRRLYEQHAKGLENPVNELRRVLEGRA